MPQFGVRPPGVLQRIEADEAEQGVEAAGVLTLGAVEQPPPHHTGGDERDRHREQVDRPEQALAPDSALEQQRPQQPEEEGADEEHHGEDREVPQRVDEPVVVGEQVVVVLQPDVAGLGLRGVPVGQRELDRPADQAVDEDRQEDERRCQQQEPWSPAADPLTHEALLGLEWVGGAVLTTAPPTRDHQRVVTPTWAQPAWFSAAVDQRRLQASTSWLPLNCAGRRVDVVEPGDRGRGSVCQRDTSSSVPKSSIADCWYWP